MARRRMISQDLISDKSFNSISIEAQNLFIRMLAISDDCGVVPIEPYKLSVLINPPERIKRNTEKYIAELLENNLGNKFLYQDEQYFAFKKHTFDHYQSYILKKATKSEYLRISIEEFLGISKNFWKENKKCVSTVESREYKVESIKQKAESKGYNEEFEKLWLLCPNRQGKKEALKHFMASVKTQQDLKDITIAINNYRESDKVKKGYIQNGKTWFNNWRDWITSPEIKLLPCPFCGEMFASLFTHKEICNKNPQNCTPELSECDAKVQEAINQIRGNK